MKRMLPVLLLLAACGGASGSGNQSATAEDGATPTDATAEALAEVDDARAMTAIDAASGDAKNMPGEFTGTTAGEIAARRREREAAAQSAMDKALDAAEGLSVSLPDPVTGAAPAGGETAVVETE